MHQKIDAYDLVELVDAQSTNCLENTEENCTKYDAPRHYDNAAEALCLYHGETTSIYQSQVLVENSNSKAAPHTASAKNLEASNWVIDLVSIEELACCHTDKCGDPTDDSAGTASHVVARG